MIDSIDKLIEESLDTNLNQIVVSNGPSNYEITKIKVRPILLKEKIVFQASSYIGKQIFHNNYSKEELIHELSQWLDKGMKQILISTQGKESTVLISKKGKVTVKSRKISNENNRKNVTLSHNREKSYILTEGRWCLRLLCLLIKTEMNL